MSLQEFEPLETLPNGKTAWPPAALDYLKANWGIDGGATARQIAEHCNAAFGMSITRSAACGMATRQGLSKSTGVPRPRKIYSRRPPGMMRVVIPTPPPSRPAFICAEAAASPVTLMGLNGNTCRYPIGDPREADFAYCGAPPKGGHPYCAAHCAVAYMPLRPAPRPYGSHWR